MKTCKVWLLGALLSVYSLLVLAGLESNEIEGRQLEKVSVQLKWFHQFQFAGYYAAKAQGFYAEEGLDVEIRELSPGISVVNQVNSREADYGVGDSGIIADYANGTPLKALAAIYQHNPLIFISKQSSGIISPYEMRNKRIMFDKSDGAPLQALLAQAGLTSNQYTVVAPTYNNEDLLQDNVDVMYAYLTDEPLDFKKLGVDINIIQPQNYGIDFYGDILFTSMHEFEQNPGRAERFRRASLKGWKYALDNPEEIIQLIHSRYKSRLSIEHLRYEAEVTRKLILPDTIPLGQITPERLRRVADVFANQNLAKPLNDHDLKDFVYVNSPDLGLSAKEREWLSLHPVIRIGSEQDFAPYGWIDDSGNYVGLVADYMHLLEQRLGIRFEIIKDRPWPQYLEMAKHSELDMFSFVAKIPQRDRSLNFSAAYVDHPVAIISSTSKGYIGNLDHLAGKSVVIETDYLLNELIENDYPDIKIVNANNLQQALGMVVAGAADAYLGDIAQTNYAIQKNAILGLQASGYTPYRFKLSFGSIKSEPLLASIMGKALSSISTDERAIMYDRWMSQPVETGIRPETLYKYGLAILFLFLLFSYWIYRLRTVQKALQQSEGQLHAIINNTPASLWAVDVDGRYTFVNKTFCDATGIPESDFLKTTRLADLLGEESAANFIQSDQACLAQTTPLQTHETFTFTDGTPHEMDVIKTRLTNAKGETTGIIGIGIDITERKQAEESMQLAALVYENSSEAMAVSDAEGNILTVNPAFCKTTGYSQDEAIGKSFNTLSSGRQGQAFYQFMMHEVSTVGYWQGEIWNQRKNGEIFPEWLTINTIFNDDGSVHRYVALFSDISHQKETQALAEAKELAEAATRAKSNFLANMSHEIRTPMNAIIGMTQLALQTELTSTQQNYLNKVELSAQSLLGLISDILDFSKIEAGKLDFEKANFSLQEILDKQAALFTVSTEEKGLELLFDIADDVPLNLIADSLRLSQVLINLTNNAIKFTDTGSITLSVSADKHQHGMVRLQFSVSDTGIGISPKQQETLFQPFNQADLSTTRKYGGTGLGLAISKNLVELMDGDLWVDSQEGVGSTFYFNVRVGVQKGTHTTGCCSGTNNLKKFRTLVVDRNANTRIKLSTMLAKIGLRVEQISNAHKAAKYLEEASSYDPYELIVVGESETSAETSAEQFQHLLLESSSSLNTQPAVLMVTSNPRTENRFASKNCIIISQPVTPSKLLDSIMLTQGLSEIPSYGSVATNQDEIQQAIEHLQGAKILLVEDNEINLELAVILLKSNGMNVTVAENGREALSALKNKKFDGVLMDCQMPIMDGYTATREIRSNPRWANLPILAMTANAMVEDKDEALAAGMNDHISKPINVADMFNCMAKWISPSKNNTAKAIADITAED